MATKMKLFKSISFLLLCACALQARAQWKGDSTWKNQEKEPALELYRNKKFYWGFTFSQNFSQIKDNSDTITYFRKPSLHGGFRVEYYPLEFLGISAGFSYAQRGAGIKLPDVVKSLGDPDSTNRTRLRFNTIDFPIQLIFRSPFITERWRLHAGIGIAPVINFKTNRVFQSVEDGFHAEENQTGLYFKSDFDINFSLGLNIDVTGAAILQVHLVGGMGTANVYNSAAVFGNATGKNNYFGLRLATLF